MLEWLIVIIAAIVLEAATLDLVTIWLVLGAIVGAILNLLGFSLVIQIVVCAIVTLACAILIRPICKKYLTGNTVRTNADRVIGKQGVLTKSITPDAKGEVKVMGVTWSAIALDSAAIEEGKHVSILAIEGNKLIVKEI